MTSGNDDWVEEEGLSESSECDTRDQQNSLSDLLLHCAGRSPNDDFAWQQIYPTTNNSNEMGVGLNVQETLDERGAWSLYEEILGESVSPGEGVSPRVIDGAPGSHILE